MPPRSAAERRLVRAEREQLDARPDVRVAHLAAQERGVLSVRELRACGLSHDAIATRVRSGRLHPWYRGVYVVGHADPPLESRWLAAVKACGPLAAAARFMAAAHLGFLPWEDRLPDVVVPGPGTRVHPGIRVHRTEARDPRDFLRHEGIPVTSPARTLVELAAVLPSEGLRRAVRQAESIHRTSVPQLLEALERLRPRRGAARLAAVLADGPAPTRSVLEDRVLGLIVAGGLEPPQVNVALVVDGRRLVPDFRWPGPRLVVEADGAAWHDGALARRLDAERQALLEAAGERVIRLTWPQVVSRPRETLARLRAAGAPSRA